MLSQSDCEKDLILEHYSKAVTAVMVYPNSENLDNPKYYIVIDFFESLPITSDDMILPFYLQSDDVVVVACADKKPSKTS